MPTASFDSPKPFLKWVGGKRQLMDHLVAALPAHFNRYFEPFVGGGALFFELQPVRAFLWDSNEELIDTYITLRDDVEGVIRHLKRHVYQKEHYYEVRAKRVSRLSPQGRAARMIFLNRTGFNGLYRVNQRGEFNVPFGRHANPRICNEQNLRAVSKSLIGVDLRATSFEAVLKNARKGDFIYLDPPYIPLSKTSNFVAYQKHGFGLDNQEVLADVIEQLDQRGCYIMLSNSDVPWMKKRYRKFHIEKVSASRNVNSKATARGHVGELIVTNYR
ncbi:MAG: DNA adenine methylase [Deltaproteobacteria bacterium]|nr:DNA adenine methylase [Deltaproteobacteria bacterium]MBN2670621.1 DNA adenine methylase [Deltaproteobacteria bacterium]